MIIGIGYIQIPGFVESSMGGLINTGQDSCTAITGKGQGSISGYGIDDLLCASPSGA
ncbi:MAG TPA: hypothetical protein VNZ86_05990 [Bacteroidia bacterium]|jgi:hypothetical protein|nr:hypothetical protein [Bacteroidia bacterium]